MNGWLQEIEQNEIAEAQASVLEWMDRALQKKGVSQAIRDDVWDAALKHFALQEA